MRLLILFCTLCVFTYSQNIPPIYEVNFKTTYLDENKFYFSNLIVLNEKSSITNYAMSKTDIAICTKIKKHYYHTQILVVM